MTLMADALDLVHRLPHTWRRAQTFDIPIWRARRVAQKTHALTVKAAAHVDRVLAPRLPTLGVTLLDRTVAQAIADPHARGARHPRGTAAADLGRGPAPPEPDRVRRHQRAPRHRGHDDPHPPLRPDLRHRRRPQDRTATQTPRRPQGQRRSGQLAGTPKTKLYLHLDAGAPVGPGREARPRHRSPRSRTGSATPGSPSNPSSTTGPHRPGRRPRPTRLDARPGPPPRPPLRVPALPTRRPRLRPRPHHPLRRHRPTRPNPTRQPRPAVPTTPPRQNHRPLAIPPTTRRHLRLGRSRHQESRGSGRDRLMPVRPTTYPSCSLSRRIGVLPTCVQV